MREWKPLAAHAGHDLTLHLPETVHVWALSDDGVLRRVLTILLDNAVKYTPAPGYIDVFLEERGRRAVVSVNDTGIGIPAPNNPRSSNVLTALRKRVDAHLEGRGWVWRLLAGSWNATTVQLQSRVQPRIEVFCGNTGRLPACASNRGRYRWRLICFQSAASR
jgi:light-regulated signal transduction histidine kinase (bacteriophytochrome)